MRPFSLGVTTLIQGVFMLAWVAVLFDVASPTFNLGGLPDWSGMRAVGPIILLLTAAVGLGVVMHTISRAIFRSVKDKWAQGVLQSPTVKQRLVALDATETFPGGPRYEDFEAADAASRPRHAGAFLHAISFQLMQRSPHLWESIQIYRDQYRLARGFVVPAAAFALVLPLWAPIAALDSAGYIGPLPIIRTQLVLLSVLAAAVSYAAFRERTYRYSAAMLLAYATLEGEQRKDRA